ncbi:hypothetical protein [Streptomyces sp. NPDC057623]|uniref:hypothetical protein n=1 Tax=Streptomyces sp. NPDC057623 TaxID=3346187 RepID=UPI003674950A
MTTDPATDVPISPSCAKLLRVQSVEELRDEGVGFAGYATGALGRQPGDPDVIAHPDARSYTPIPSSNRASRSCTATVRRGRTLGAISAPGPAWRPRAPGDQDAADEE